jgi:hypothetical protein
MKHLRDFKTLLEYHAYLMGMADTLENLTELVTIIR